MTAATAYYAYFLHRDSAGTDSAIAAASVFTTDAADTTAPVLSLPTGFQTGPTAATVGATTDEGNGTLYVVVTTSGTAPTKAQVKSELDSAGAAAAAASSQAVAITGAKTFSITGLSASTAYYAHFMHEDAAANQSTVLSSATFTTSAAPDVTAPTLSSPTDTQTGTTTATLTVSTNEANGTLYWFVSTSATPPSGTNLKTGTGAVASGTQTITTTGVKTVSVTGLTAGTAYYSYFLHRDAAGNDSSVSSADGFTTTALGAGVLDTNITAPVLSLAVLYSVFPPQFDAALDDTVSVGDTIELRWDDDIRFGSVTSTATNVIDSSEAAADAASFTGLSSIGSGTNYFQARVVQATTNNYSNWSNTVLHGAATDSTPASFSFTDQTGVALSTVITSAAVQLTGFNQPVTISVTGGEYATSPDNVTYSAFTSSAGTVYPNDYIKARNTSSGSNSTAVNTVVTVGGVSDTFTSTTLAASVSLPTSGLLLQLDADDTSTLFQLITAATAAADGQPIGTWQDKSGAGFHLTAAANDTTRPTYRTNSGLPYVEFDGTNDILRRLAALGLYTGGACTVAIALKTLNATQATSNLGIFMEGSSSSNNPVYEFGSSGGSSDDVSAFIRNDANTQINLSNNTVLGTGLDAGDNVLLFTDSGSAVLAYDDGSAFATRTYTRSGTLTLDRFAIAGWQRGAPGTWLGTRIYAFAAWNRVLNSTERATVLTYMAAKQGRAL